MDVFVPYRSFRRGFGRLGVGVAPNVVTGAQGIALTTAGISAGTAIAAGASAGAIAGPIGAAVGALAGLVSGILSPSPNTAAHIGSWDTQLVNALAQLPSTVAGIGRQIPWNEDGHGLVQYLEALLACGQYMAWDPSLISNYDVCAHWAMTLSTACQVVAQAVCQNAKGAKVTVQVTAQPGGPVGPGPFSFTNPGIAVGPEAVTSAVIMGPNGVMTWLFNRWQIAGTAALSKQYASEMGSNAPAAKVYALMVDYVAGQENTPDTAPAKPVPNVTQVPAAAASAVQTAIATAPAAPAAPAAPKPMSTIQPIASAAQSTVSPAPAAQTPVTVPATPTPVATTASGSTVTDADIANLISALQTNSSNQQEAVNSALSQLESQGVDTTQPAVQQAVQNAVSPGLSTTDWLLIGGGALALILLLKK
jgi:hypothetical protein